MVAGLRISEIQIEPAKMCSDRRSESALPAKCEEIGDVLLFEVVENAGIVSDKLGVSFNEPELRYNQHQTDIIQYQG